MRRQHGELYFLPRRTGGGEREAQLQVTLQLSQQRALASASLSQPARRGWNDEPAELFS